MSAAAASPHWRADTYAVNAAFVPALGAAALALLAPQPGERILDIGCGDGALTARIAAAGAHVTGIDAAPDMVRAARARGLDAQVMDAQAIALPGPFDAVFSNAALHWMPDSDAVLRGVRRVLRPGGRFVGEFGGHGNVAAIMTALRAAADRYGVAMGDAPFYPTAAAWAARLTAHGFVVREAGLFARPTVLPTGLAGWLETFRPGLVAALPAAAMAQVEAWLAPSLRDERGTWVADYVRLRFAALRQ